MREEISINIPFSEFEEIQKGWIKEVLSEVQPPQQKEDELITRKETAQFLGVSLVTLNQYTKDGIIPGYRIGSRVRYKKHEVLESLKGFKKYRRRDNDE